MAGRLVKLIVSIMVGAGDALMRLLGGRRPPGSCVVINYHSISDESKLRLGKQLDLLLHLTRPVLAAKELALEEGARYVAVTADDAFCSFIRNGLPELCQRRIPVMVFVPTGYLGRKSAWDDYGGENRVGEEVASAGDLKRIAEFDTVDFGSHCVTHPDLVRLSEEEVARELRDSKASLGAIVGREIVALSFPYGSYGPRELRLASEAGYKFCFDSTPQSVTSAIRGGLSGRVSVQPTDSNIVFRLKILGAYRWVRWASSCKQRMLSSLRRN
jgi:peptidoglycan/xylan/chitin deacetylase (PgdA/CDA1 family)